MSKKVNVYYTTLKPKHGPNQRAFYISRWIGVPFVTYNLVPELQFEHQKSTVAKHLGLRLGQIEWHPHRGHKKIKESSNAN